MLMLGESLQTTEAVGQYLRSLVITAEAEVKYGVPELDIAAAKKGKNTFKSQYLFSFLEHFSRLVCTINDF